MLRYLHPIPACATLVLALGSAAFATDLPAPVYKAPVYKAPAAASLYNWSGVYIGGNVGYGWGKANTDIAYAGGNAFDTLNPDPNNPPDLFPPFAHSDSLKLNGPNGGGQIGYNWQFAPTWVLGIEADLQTSRQKNSNRFVDSFSLSDHADNQTILDGTTVTDHEGEDLLVRHGARPLGLRVERRAAIRHGWACLRQGLIVGNVRLHAHQHFS